MKVFLYRKTFVQTYEVKDSLSCVHTKKSIKIVCYSYVKYITSCVRIRGLARVVVHYELYTSHICKVFYYIRESVLVQFDISVT